MDFDDLLQEIKQLMIAKLSFVLNCLRDISFLVKSVFKELLL